MRAKLRPTPLVDLGAHGLRIPNGNRILAKVEFDRECHPTGSHYDRVFHPLIEMHERGGLKTHNGKTLPPISPATAHLVETTTGSAGRAFARAAKERGYAATILAFPCLPSARLATAREDGATIQEVVFADILHLRSMLQAFLARKHDSQGRRYICLNHSIHVQVSQAMAGIVEEAFSQSRCPIDIYVPAIGTGASVLVPGHRFKQLNPNGIIVAWEPFGTGVAYDELHHDYFDRFGISPGRINHPLLGANRPGPLMPMVSVALSEGLIDRVMLITDDLQSALYHHLCRRLALPPRRLLLPDWEIMQYRLETALLFGIIGGAPGRTSLAGLATALHLAESVENKTFLVPFYDSIERY